MDNSGITQSYGPISLIIPEEGDDPESPDLPKIYGLHQNYPNPFNPSGAGRSPVTTIYLFAEDVGLRSTPSGQAKIEIYNLKGQKVKTFDVTLLAKPKLGEGWSLCHPACQAEAGRRLERSRRAKDEGCQATVIWNGTDDYGKPVSSGIYLYQLNVNGKTEAINKMLLLR